MQICTDLHILHRKGLYKDIEHLFLGVINHKNKLKQSIELLKNYSRREDLEILYPTFLDDFEKTSKELRESIIYSTELLDEYLKISKQIYKIYKQYSILQ